METLLWQWRERWRTRYDEKREKMGSEVFNVNDDDLADWEEFAEKNYQESMPQYPSMALIPLLLVLCVR